MYVQVHTRYVCITMRRWKMKCIAEYFTRLVLRKSKRRRVLENENVLLQCYCDREENGRNFFIDLSLYIESIL